MRRTLVGSAPGQWLAWNNLQQVQTTGENVEKQQEPLSGESVGQRKWTGLVAWRLIVMTVVWIVVGGAFLLTQVLAVEGTMLAFGAQLLGIVYRPLTLLVVAVALLHWCSGSIGSAGWFSSRSGGVCFCWVSWCSPVFIPF